MYETS